MKNKGQKEKHRLPLIFFSQRISVQVDIGVLSQIMTTVAIDQCACVCVCLSVHMYMHMQVESAHRISNIYFCC